MSIRQKVVLICLALISMTIALGCFGWCVYLDIITRHELVDLRDETAARASALETLGYQARIDVLELAGDETLRSLLAPGPEDEGGAQRTRLDTFQSRMGAVLRNPERDYFKIELLDAGGGVVSAARLLEPESLELLPAAEWEERRALKNQWEVSHSPGTEGVSSAARAADLQGGDTHLLTASEGIEITPPGRAGGRPLLVASARLRSGDNAWRLRLSADLDAFARRQQMHLPRHVTLVTDLQGRPVLYYGMDGDLSGDRPAESIEQLMSPNEKAGWEAFLSRPVSLKRDEQFKDFSPATAEEETPVLSGLFSHHFCVARRPDWLDGETPLTSLVGRGIEKELIALGQRIPGLRYYDTSKGLAKDDRIVVSGGSRDDVAQAVRVLRDYRFEGDGGAFGGESLTIGAIRKTETFPLQAWKLSWGDKPEYVFVRAGSYEEIAADVNDTLQRDLMGPFLLMLTAVLLIGLVGPRFIGRPLRGIAQGANRLAEGEYVEVRVPGANDEISQLAKAFNHMVRAVRDQTETLESAKAHSRAIVDLATDGIITVKDDGWLLCVNMAASKMFRMDLCPEQPQLGFSSTRTQLFDLNKSTTLNVDPALAAGSTALTLPQLIVRAIAMADEGEKFEAEAVRYDDSVFPVEVAVGAFSVDDTRCYSITVCDTTVRKRYHEELKRTVEERTRDLESVNRELTTAKNELEHAQAAREQFLASVSHELRTPLTTVLGFCKELELTELDDDQRADLNRISAAGNRLLRLVKDILDYQKIIIGRLPIETKPVDLSRVIESLVDAHRKADEGRGLEIRFACERSPLVVNTDADRVTQVLDNLIGNACKFTDRGWVECRLSTRDAADRGLVRIEVRDSGRGMSPDQQRKLFRPFTRILDRAENPNGTGLGLVICRGICRALGGDVYVDSRRTKPGEGSVFVMDIEGLVARDPGDKPSRPAPHGIAEAQSLPPADAPATSTPNRRPQQPGVNVPAALIVDDDHDVAELLQRFFEEAGFTATVATNGVDAIEAAAVNRPDIITLDAQMPGLDGWQVMRLLKDNPDTADIPVVFITIVDDQQRGIALGASGFLGKPIDWDRLAALVKKHCPDPRGANVLVIEDDPDSRRLVKAELERLGCVVAEAEHGGAALVVLEDFVPDLILLDLMMPVMDGFEFLATLHDHEQLRDVTVVVVSGKEIDKQDRERLLGRVADVVDKNTLDWSDVEKELRRLLANHCPETATTQGGP